MLKENFYLVSIGHRLKPLASRSERPDHILKCSFSTKLTAVLRGNLIFSITSNGNPNESDILKPYGLHNRIKSTYFFSTLICKLFLWLLLTINYTVSIIIKSGIEETDEHLEEALKEGNQRYFQFRHL